MWRNWNPHVCQWECKRVVYCLFGKQFDTFWKSLPYTYHRHQQIHSKIYPKVMKTFIHPDFYVNVHSSLTDHSQKQFKCLSTGQWTNKMQYIHKREYYSVVKWNEVLIPPDWLEIDFWEFMESGGNVKKLDSSYGCITL